MVFIPNPTVYDPSGDVPAVTGNTVQYTDADMCCACISEAERERDRQKAGFLASLFTATESDKFIKRVRSDEARYCIHDRHVAQLCRLMCLYRCTECAVAAVCLRYKAMFLTMEMTKNFYFSYTFDLTRSMQVATDRLHVEGSYCKLLMCRIPVSLHGPVQYGQFAA